MIRTHKNHWLLALAVGAAVPALMSSSIVSGQVRSGNDGAALDANNRVGSGGRNEGPTGVDNRTNAQRATGNQIVTGNVTGNKQFRDTVDYTDPNEFRDTTGTEDSSAFIRRSSGIGDARSGNVMPNEARPFYDPSLTVQPPEGFTQAAPGVGAYVPKPPPENTVNNAAGFQNTLQPLSPIPQPGVLVLPGPTDENGQSLLTASPLYGVRQWRPGQASDQQFLSDLSNSFSGRRDVQLNQADLQRMREEISTPADGEGEGEQPSGVSNTVESKPVSSSVKSQGLSTPLTARAAGSDVTSARQGTRNRILATPEQQSPRYAEMRRRLEKYNSDRNATDQEAHQAFVEVQRARETAKRQPGQPGLPTGTTAERQPIPGAGGPAGVAQQKPPVPEGQKPEDAAPSEAQSTAEKLGLPDYAKRSEEVLRGEKPAEGATDPKATRAPTLAPRPEPVKVPSLAEGAQGQGFTELLIKAEELMKEGKFTSALDEYDRAEQVAPNNPLIRLGRANAELGASYYSRAESHLREAFTADPALLIGQYDLRAFYGEDRLRTLVNDLKEIARTEERQARPVFLLAYIAYNTGNERMAGGYLDLAEKRGGGKDPLYKLIRDHWRLPDDATPADVETPESGTNDLNK